MDQAVAPQAMDLVSFQERIIERLRSGSAYDPGSSMLDILCANQRYLVSAQDVLSILSVPPRTRIPKTKSWLLGAVNIRGDIYSVVDMGRFFGGERTEVGNESTLLMIHPKFNSGACLLVDAVVGLVDVSGMEKRGESYFDKQSQLEWRVLDIGEMVASETFLKVKR